MKRTLIFFLLFIAGLSPAPFAVARTAILLERKHFIGVWQGYCPDAWDFVRLELDGDGGGFMASSELPNTPVRTYRVQWHYEDGHATLTVTPLGPRAPKITIHDVQYATNAIEFELRGEGYKRKMHLFNATDVERRITETTARIKEARNAKLSH